MTPKIHVAFGFHINLYHSFRGDSLNDQGFGMDLRIINGILRDLKKLNDAGIPVKGTWDMDNAFSLGHLIPKHAPELITEIRNRLEHCGDEVILMSYNNGIASGMENDELEACVQWAIRNKDHSGILDVFGQYAPLVRPQEMMLTPSNILVYQALGIQGLCLYYSSAPFDAFRTMIPPLGEAEAFYPLLYEHDGMIMPIIPMISHFDLMDYGSLYAMLKSLRRKQKNGEISSDLLVFLNMDADAPFWEGFSLPGRLGREKNVTDLYATVKQISRLEGVLFDTPYNFLKSHPPKKVIHFGQDLADGSFDGYANWSEKPANHNVWTRIEQARILTRKLLLLMDNPSEHVPVPMEHLLAAAFEKRLRLLSSTHFGLSSPWLHKDREKAIDCLIDEMMDPLWLVWMRSKRRWEIVNAQQNFLPEVLRLSRPEVKAYFQICFLKDRAQERTLHLVLLFNEGVVRYLSELKLMDDMGNIIRVTFVESGRHADNTISEVEIFAVKIKGSLRRVWVIVCEATVGADYGDLLVDQKKISGNDLEILSHDLKLQSFKIKGQVIGDEDFLQSFIHYQSKDELKCYAFTVRSKALICPEEGGAAGYRFSGVVDLPGQIRAGSFKMDLFLVAGVTAILVKMKVSYPLTPEHQSAWNEFDSVGRSCDRGWLETAPLQIQVKAAARARILKYNYQHVSGTYSLSSFQTADPLNQSLDAFNHHVTCGRIGVADEDQGLLLAVDRWLLSGLAFCPMRMAPSADGYKLKLNPFGTYHGSQKHHGSFGTEISQKLIASVSPNHKAMAPAYNGATTRFTLAILPFSGEIPTPEQLQFAEALNSSEEIFIPENRYAEEKLLNHGEKVFREGDEKTNDPIETRLFKSLLNEIPIHLKWQVGILLFKARKGMFG